MNFICNTKALILLAAPPSYTSLPFIMGFTLYFAYGSNLSLTQMHSRCPSSEYVGVARLHGYRWIVNTRGFANVVECQGSEVYGLLYQLTEIDEAKLDECEGVPFAYEKEVMKVEIWRTREGVVVDMKEKEKWKGECVEVLVYVD